MSFKTQLSKFRTDLILIPQDLVCHIEPEEGAAAGYSDPIVEWHLLKEFRSPDSPRIRGSLQSIFAYFSDIRPYS